MDPAAALQSALNPHGPEASAIATLTWVMVAGGAAVLLLVTILAALALRAPRPWLARSGAIVAGGIALPAVVLLALLAYGSVAAPRPFGAGAPAVTIEVVGRQWWWELRYLKPDGSLDFRGANEIHVPAGQPVELRLKTADVLHSFWVPSLAGKLDLVPGRTNVLRIAADTAGTYRGQCAEYCGGPHALMGLLVVAENGADYAAWAEAQHRPAVAAPGRGSEVFASLCASCHAVRGTGASGTLGPDLTHVASRKTLAAGALANDDASRARWIAAGQHVKPGNLMPEYPQMPREDLAALSTWLAQLR
jgi:cytochrome c oxidase subunit II